MRDRVPQQHLPLPRRGEHSAAVPYDYASSDSSPVRARSHVVVSAEGRTCTVDFQAVRTLADFQGALQGILGVERQAKVLLDVQGAPIQTDGDLLEAVKQGRTPLSVAPVEDVAGLALTPGAGGSSWGKQEIYAPRTPPARSPAASEVQDGQAMQLLQEERLVRQAEMRQVDERLTSIVALVESERTCREASVDAMRAQLDTLRGALETERASRQQDKRTSDSAMQGVKAEHYREDSLVDVKLKALEKRVQDMIQGERDTLVDGTAMLRRTIDELVAKVERQGRSIKPHAEVPESDRTDAATPAEAESFTKISERCDDLEQRLETVKFDHKQLQDTTKWTLNRLTVMESALAATLARSATSIDAKMSESAEIVSNESLQDLMHAVLQKSSPANADRLRDCSPLMSGDAFLAAPQSARGSQIRSPSAGFKALSTNGPGLACTPAAGGRLLTTPLISPNSASSTIVLSRPGSVVMPIPAPSPSAPTSQRSSSIGHPPFLSARGALSPPRAGSPPASARASGGRAHFQYGSALVAPGQTQYMVAPRMPAPTLETYASRGQGSTGTGRGAEG